MYGTVICLSPSLSLSKRMSEHVLTSTEWPGSWNPAIYLSAAKIEDAVCGRDKMHECIKVIG